MVNADLSCLINAFLHAVADSVEEIADVADAVVEAGRREEVGRVIETRFPNTPATRMLAVSSLRYLGRVLKWLDISAR
jgi:hypothetical protein